jgi:hypothetical protein
MQREKTKLPGSAEPGWGFEKTKRTWRVGAVLDLKKRTGCWGRGRRTSNRKNEASPVMVDPENESSVIGRLFVHGIRVTARGAPKSEDEGRRRKASIPKTGSKEARFLFS